MVDSRSLVTRIMIANEALVKAMILIREAKDQYDQLPNALVNDPSWTQSYPKFTEEDITEALGGWGQILFAYDSGAPTQKSKIFGILT